MLDPHMVQILLDALVLQIAEDAYSQVVHRRLDDHGLVGSLGAALRNRQDL